MTNGVLQLSLSGPDMQALVHAVAELPEFAGAPTRVLVDYDECPVTADWVGDYGAAATSNLSVFWAPPIALQFVGGEAVFVWLPMAAEPSELMAFFSKLPIELAVVAPLYEEWTDDDDFERYGFGDRHATHGFACAFKGDGLKRLVSNRWLEYGPWVVHKAGDVTLVQFHDLAAAPMTALAQANPGRLLLSREDETGYLAPQYRYQHDLAGVHDATCNVLKIPVHDREISAAELRDACAVRRDKRDDAEAPIEQVAYVFMEEARARTYLHALWLRGLECWAFVDGIETRLDTDYTPPPTQLDWGNG